MSVASKVGQVIFSQKSGVYMPAIMCDKGDLYQEYDGESGAPTNIAPRLHHDEADALLPSHLLTGG